MASAAQCEHLFDRYVDLRLSEDRGAARMTSEERAHLRAALATEALARDDVHKVRTRCQTAVSEEAFRCAIAAPTARAWSDCLR